jgi:hypothetical protein
LVQVHSSFFSVSFASEILSPEQLKEGRRQLDRHKRLMERATKRASLKEKINFNTEGAKLSAAAISSTSGWLAWWKKAGT